MNEQAEGITGISPLYIQDKISNALVSHAEESCEECENMAKNEVPCAIDADEDARTLPSYIDIARAAKATSAGRS
jgi:predicted Ser/Thr protein kinase